MAAEGIVEIRMLRPGDERLLRNVAASLFDYAVEPGFAAEFLSDPRHHIAVAIEGQHVVGFASGVHYVHPDKPAELWINEVGVAPTHRKRGIGKAVVRALLERGRQLGCREAWVLTQPENAAARRLYTSAGGKEEPAPMMFSFKC